MKENLKLTAFDQKKKKCDMSPPGRISDHEIAAKCKDLGFIAWYMLPKKKKFFFLSFFKIFFRFAVSAKENINIGEAMNALIKNIIQEGSFANPNTQAPGVVQVAISPAGNSPQESDSACGC